jgi:hypothetical protein
MWVGDTVWKQPEKIPLFLDRLREMGINTGMAHGEADPAPFVTNHFPFYVENMVNRGLCLKWNSNVRDWDKFVTDWANNGRPKSALVRDYCLDDPQWRTWAEGQVKQLASKNAPFSPVAYNLRDELSVTISANPFDYDFNPIALAHFRDWLKTQYGTLDALNAEWETHFTAWDAVEPFTTDEIKNRMASNEALPRGKPDWQAVEALHFDPDTARKTPTRWNFSPWADFRTYNDISLARCLSSLRDAVRTVDPRTPVGIEGTQMPNTFGGYDLWRLSQALDWMEPYDVGNAREILGSFMPAAPILTTVFESDSNHARRRLWHLLLEGDHGCIVWWSEDCIDWKSPDYALTPKARALAPVLKEMTSPLAQLFENAEREKDPVFILYSQPSIQVDWLLESTVDGSTWLRRFSSFEADHNQLAKIRDGWLKVFEDLGYSPQFISSEQLENGRWPKSASAVLVLPSALALSDREIAEINRFSSQPAQKADKRNTRHVFSDGIPGEFDEHCKLRSQPPHFAALSTESLASKSIGDWIPTRRSDVLGYAQARLNPASDLNLAREIRARLKEPALAIQVAPTSRVRVHRFRRGDAILVAFERNVEYQMSEDLKQAGGNESLETPLDVDVLLDKSLHAYDLRNNRDLGSANHLQFRLDPWQPSLFALTRQPLSASPSYVEELLQNH